MRYSVDTTPNFEKEAKRLIKKYQSLKAEIHNLVEVLANEPFQGKHLGNSIYKIRIAVKSKGKGKRGGARIMTMVKIADEKVYLFSIYSKGEKDAISDTEIQDLIKDIQ
ncbi:MAG: type II toxin-antitoxin system RelE/ParE family toxin [Bacteroidales bacterium]|nr:type II toxin-antitoxin system RelE/ParE family toxin [Bacteroidales bacterium]MCF8457466.1 type II toxin-antitoxin system RelE/ParE family toxin [Bacteroidales bacterium]